MANIIVENGLMYETQINSDITNGTKNWYVEGVFSKPDVINGNRRIYPNKILESAVNSYVSEYVDTKRALGELDHPPSLNVNLDKVSHLIESIKFNGSEYVGRAKILKTPMGNIASGILESGAVLGISSRGAGTLKKNSKQIDEVQSDFKLVTLDLVSNPSCREALLQGIYESATFITDNVDEQFVQLIGEELRSISKTQLDENKIKLYQKFMQHLSGKA